MRKETRTQNKEGMKKGKEKEREKEKEKKREIENKESSKNYSSEEEIESREEENNIIYDDEKEEEKNSFLIQIRGISNQEIPATLDKLEESGVIVDINLLYTNANSVMSSKIYNIDTSRRNGNATDILIDLKEQWHQLKRAKEEKINIFSNYYSRPFWFSKYKYNEIIKHMIEKHKINTYKNEIPRNNKIKVSNHYLRVTGC